MNGPIDDHQVSKDSHRRSKASIIKTPLGQPTPSTGMSKQHASLTCVTVVSFDSARLVASGAHFCPQAKKKRFQFGQNKLTAVCFCWPSEVVWADPKTETKKNRSIPVGTHSLRPHWLRPFFKKKKIQKWWKKTKERGRSSASFSLCRSLISVFSLLWLTGLTTLKKMAWLSQVRHGDDADHEISDTDSFGHLK